MADRIGWVNVCWTDLAAVCAEVADNVTLTAFDPSIRVVRESV
jgi:hypothetical protein